VTDGCMDRASTAVSRGKNSAAVDCVCDEMTAQLAVNEAGGYV